MSKTSEETLQRDFVDNPNRIGKYKYYNAGATTIGSFKVSKLIPDKKYENECRKPDGLICLGKKVIAVVENKALHAYDTSEKVAGASKQAFDVAKDLGAKFVISTDTLSSEWINAFNGYPIIDELGNPIKIVFNLKTSNTIPMEKLIDKLNDYISFTCNNLPQVEYVDPTPLAKQVWQMIYASTGASPENCLYTFIEMFIFKYLSDLGILTGSKSFNEFIKLYKQDSPDSVLSDYATKIRPEIKRLFPASSDDSTTIINGTIFVEQKNGIEEAKTGYGETFKDILERFRDFGELKDIDLDFKSKVFEIFFKEDTQKGGMGQYFTPLKVVRQMVNMVDVKEGMTICDPACGVGKFLLDTASRNLNSFYDIEDEKLTNKIILEGYDKGFTKDNERTIILAKANMMIYFSELIKKNPSPAMTKKFSDLFNATFHLKTSILGTLEDTPVDKYDIILSNPPYLVSGSQPIKNAIISDTKLNSHYTKKGTGLEGLFLEWIVRALKPEGTALVIIPDGIMTRSTDSTLRQFILDECDVECIISLPINTFFTTNKKTFIICLKKKNKNDKRKQMKPVLTYLVSSIGETLDVNRFDIEENDLDDAQYQYRVFKMDKDKYMPNNKRCKIIPIDKLYTDVKFNWFIDNYWTDEEKIELGIKNETNVVSLSEFETFIGDVITDLNTYKKLIGGLSNNG